MYINQLENIFIAIPVLIIAPLAAYTYTVYSKLQKALADHPKDQPLPEEVVMLFNKVKKLSRLNMALTILWIFFGYLSLTKRL